MKLIEFKLKSIPFFLALFLLFPEITFPAPGPAPGRNWVLDSNTDSIVLGQAAPLSALGAPGRNWVLDYRYDSVTCTNCGGGGGGVTSVTASLPLLSSGGTTPNISLPQSSSSQDGYLSQGDWSLFNAKQPAGNYITALTGDVTASGPGSVPSTLKNIQHEYWVDVGQGSDSNTGTIVSKWLTIQHACNNVVASINFPAVIHLSGGNNDAVAGHDPNPIVCPPNINIIADGYGIQTQPITISGGNGNDGVTLTNLLVLGNITWIRNDNTAIGMTLNNTGAFGLVDFEQQGAGVSSSIFLAYGANAALTGGVTIQAAEAILQGAGLLIGNFNYKDSGSSFLIISGGVDLLFLTIQLNGGVTAEFSGNIADAGYAMTGTTTGSGTPTILTDSGSIPPSVSGAFTLSLTSQAKYVHYSAGTPGDWAASPPSDVASAIDRMASLLKTLNGGSPIP